MHYIHCVIAQMKSDKKAIITYPAFLQGIELTWGLLCFYVRQGTEVKVR